MAAKPKLAFKIQINHRELEIYDYCLFSYYTSHVLSFIFGNVNRQS